MNAIQENQLSFQSSVYKGWGPPGSVSIWKCVPLLQQITRCHILKPVPTPTGENTELIFKTWTIAYLALELPLSECNVLYNNWEVIFSNPSKRKIFRIFSWVIWIFSHYSSTWYSEGFFLFFSSFLFRIFLFFWNVHLVLTQMMAFNFYRTSIEFYSISFTCERAKMYDFLFKNQRPYKLTGRRCFINDVHFLAAEFSWKAMLGITSATHI